jgi:carboxymethylenebutenolidase
MGHFVSVAMPKGGHMRCYLAEPVPSPARTAAIVLLQEIAGVNFHLRGVADYFAALGYIVIAPNIFWRSDETHEVDYSADGINRALALLTVFHDEQGVEDIGIVVQALRARADCTGKIAAVGYCLGGRLAFLCGAARLVDAVVAWYPTWIERRIDLAGKVLCPMNLHFPETDTHGAPDAATRIRDGLRQAPHAEVFHYPGAQHAFDSDASRPVYNRWASQLSNSRAALFLDRVLAGPSDARTDEV